VETIPTAIPNAISTVLRHIVAILNGSLELPGCRVGAPVAGKVVLACSRVKRRAIGMPGIGAAGPEARKLRRAKALRRRQATPRYLHHTERHHYDDAPSDIEW